MPGFTPEALFFDMDGLLLDTERVGCDVFLELTAPFGIARDKAEAFYRSLVGTSNTHTRSSIAEFMSGVDADAMMRDWRVGVDARMASAVPLRPTVRDTLMALARKGHRMAVVTSTVKDRALEHLDAAGLLPHFATVVGGDDVAANKPDPAPYLEAAGRLGVDPRRSAAFEDSDHGVASAVAAGCIVTQIPDLRPSEAPLPDLGQRLAGDLADAVKGIGLLT